MKNSKLQLPLSLIIISLFCACSDMTINSPEKYLEVISENKTNISDSIAIEGLIFTLQYLPKEYIAFRSYGKTIKEYNNNENLTKQYEGLQFFEFTIFNPEGRTSVSLNDRYLNTESEEFSTYLDFSIQQDFSLLDGSDKLSCCYLHREISDAITNRIKFTLAFPENINPKTDLYQDKTLEFNSWKLNLEEIKLSISASSIQSLPEFKIK